MSPFVRAYNSKHLTSLKWHLDNVFVRKNLSRLDRVRVSNEDVHQPKVESGSNAI
jgi:hypothetical protein